jgi:hypothetical protein
MAPTFVGDWTLTNMTEVNYLMAAEKPLAIECSSDETSNDIASDESASASGSDASENGRSGTGEKVQR